tara:strand:- start:425 stop:1363 length:939 start_codon:yes stop_codon:yes gene_type:complete
MELITLIILKFTRYVYQKLHKFENFQNSTLYNVFHLIWIFLIGSNHGKREGVFIKKNNSNEYKEINWNLPRNAKNIYFFIGDSNTEFLGRNYKENYNKENIFYTIWTGPTLLFSFFKSEIILKRVLFFINQLIKYHGANSKCHFIFSFGQIDIRTIFYNFITVEKYYKNHKFLINEYIKNLNDIVDIFKKKVKKENKKIKICIYFKEINPCSPKTKWWLPKKNQINALNLKLAYPVFGSLKDRVKWWSQFNLRIKNNINKKYIYLKNDKCIANNKRLFNTKYGDGNHLTDSSKIIKFQNKLIYSNKKMNDKK